MEGGASVQRKPLPHVQEGRTSPQGSSSSQEGTVLAEEHTDRREKRNLIMEELFVKVKAAFSSTFDIDPQTITLDSTPNDVPAWDSMGHVELASSLEHAFGVSFDVDDLMAMENVKEICRVVQSKVGKVQGVRV